MFKNFIRDLAFQRFCGEVDGRRVTAAAGPGNLQEFYSLEAADPHDAGLDCSICLRPAFGGVMTKHCAHIFHERCLMEALRNRRECPMCRTAMSGTDYGNLANIKEARFLHESIHKLKVICPLGCGEQMRWESLRDHLRNGCARTLLICKHQGCSRREPRGDISAHEDQCGEGPAECPCGATMKKKALQSHKESDCPMQPVPCRYCGAESVRRCDMEKHFYKCTGAVPMSKVRKLMDRMDELERRCCELEKLVSGP